MTHPDAARQDERQRPRVVVIDDSTLVREAFGMVHPGLELLGAWPTIEPLLAQRPAAELVVLDLHLGADDRPDVRQGTRAIRAVSAAGYRICLYTDESRPLVLAQCLRAGADGLVRKSAPSARAEADFLEAAAGGAVLPPSLVSLAELLERRGALPELTDRQRQVLGARARGERWASIAQRLFITERVAREHMEAVSKKLSDRLRDTSPADLERMLGTGPGDLVD
ncbi:LuxR C-terminal-related transcriptional regulator [Raineyella sp.]|uniref:HTH luxR-type domain-containing protein n=1 Tax=bioreactor metagenome TaxID=1076179 RepID=A0A644YRR9_9ZZZZ|nr:LuxR C-terminal-related transcriptional regulator [Raineyella sp.]MEA5155430.1 LuxR C-terminal-related transcriptional regulator [Raineyella sp.]